MKTTIVALITILSLSQTCWSRIGETRDEIIKRYRAPKMGRAQPPAEELLYFSFNGFSITVTLVAGRSVQEKYLRTEPDFFGNSPTPLPQASVDLFLGVNAAGKHWKPVQSSRVDSIDNKLHQVGSSPEIGTQLLKAWSLEDASGFSSLIRITEHHADDAQKAPHVWDELRVWSGDWDKRVQAYEDERRNKDIKKSGF
jgi:hypothetical protein